MPEEVKSLFVRVAASEADRIDRAADATGQSKRRLVESAVRSYLGDGGLVVGSASIEERPPEVMTAAEAAVFLRIEEDVLLKGAAAKKIPGRRIGGDWRFSRTALTDWLAGGPAGPRSS
jgi:excisionase family DNA binding protein